MISSICRTNSSDRDDRLNKYAIHTDGVGDLVLYNQLEYLYVEPPLLYCGEAPCHELSVYGIRLDIIFTMLFLFDVG